MSFFVPSNTGLTWNATNSWLSSSTATAPSTWATASTLPGSIDDVFLFGRNMTLDVTNINVQSLRNTTTGSISTSGGTLTFSSASITYTVTASNGLYAQGTLLANGVAGQTINITGSQLNGLAIAGSSYLINPLSNTTLNIIAENVGSGNAVGPVIYVTATGNNIYLTGNQTGSTGAAIYIGLASANTCNIYITGSIQSRGSTNAISYTNTALGTLSILGNVNGSTGAAPSIGNGTATTNGGPGTALIINGNVNASNTAEAIRISSLVTPTVTITGDVTGNSIYPAITYGVANNVTVTGTVTAGSSAPGIISTAAGALVTVFGKIVNVNGFQGVQSQRLILSSSATQNMAWTWQDPAGNNITYSPSTANITVPPAGAVRNEVATGTVGINGTLIVPADSDVKEGVQYDNGTKTGKMRVPSYLDVRATVAVDSGSGAIIMPTEAQVQSGVTFDSGSSKTGTYDGVAAFWGYSTASMTPGSIGGLITQSLDVRIGTITGSLISELDNTATTSNTVRRMQNAATVSTTGDQLSSYNT